MATGEYAPQCAKWELKGKEHNLLKPPCGNAENESPRPYAVETRSGRAGIVKPPPQVGERLSLCADYMPKIVASRTEDAASTIEHFVGTSEQAVTSRQSFTVVIWGILPIGTAIHRVKAGNQH